MNPDSKYPGWLQSSDGSGNLSLTIRGVLVAGVPAIVAICNHFGFAWTDNDLVQAIDGGFAAVAALVVVWGILKKLYYTRKT